MIDSLTGFGRSEVEDGDLRYSVEIRSVNNRFLEISARLPRTLAAYEKEINGRIRSRVERGKINLSIQEARDSIRKNKLNFDSSAALNLVSSLQSLSEKTGLKNDLTLSNLTQMLEYVTGDDDEEVAKKRLALVIKGVDKALDEFERMRAEEGNNLERDFRERLTHLEKVVKKIHGKADENRAGALKKLHERIERYVAADQIDEGRLEQEVAYIIDRMDVTEELVRLQSHFQLFAKALDEGGSVGKRLNFILQEMNREVNTIGSKASDAEVASWVVEAKEELEKIREQVQNVA